MRRLFILMGLTLLAIYALGTEPASGTVGSVGVALQSCCLPGAGTSPHLGCVDGACQEMSDCGLDDCSACTSCDPTATENCILKGWVWDPATCTCAAPPCDPNAEQACYDSGGTWDQTTCTCSYGCNPGSPILVSSNWATSEGCNNGQVTVCTTTWYHYVQYCQDGVTIYAEWTDEVTSCSPSGGNCDS